jgi:hypothetical protein
VQNSQTQGVTVTEEELEECRQFLGTVSPESRKRYIERGWEWRIKFKYDCTLGIACAGDICQGLGAVEAYLKILQTKTDEEILTHVVAEKMTGRQYSLSSGVARFLLHRRGLTVSDQNGNSTSVQAPDPVDPGVPR